MNKENRFSNQLTPSRADTSFSESTPTSTNFSGKVILSGNLLVQRVTGSQAIIWQKRKVELTNEVRLF